jgi:hypothetical protein
LSFDESIGSGPAKVEVKLPATKSAAETAIKEYLVKVVLIGAQLRVLAEGGQYQN